MYEKVSFAQALSLSLNHFTNGASVELVAGHFVTHRNTIHVDANGTLLHNHLLDGDWVDLLRIAIVGTHAGDPSDGTVLEFEGTDGGRILQREKDVKCDVNMSHEACLRYSRCYS